MRILSIVVLGLILASPAFAKGPVRASVSVVNRSGHVVYNRGVKPASKFAYRFAVKPVVKAAKWVVS